MAKKPQNTAGNRNEDSAPQGSKWPGKTIIRYITRALVLLIIFAWALVNLDVVLRFLGKVLALFTPFLIGGEAFGVLGMLFSVPVCAVLFSLYLEFMKKATQKNDDKHTGL